MKKIFDKRYLGSTLALIFGSLQIFAGVGKPASYLLITGVVVVLGTLAYRSAKRRKFGDVKTSWVRISFEVVAMLIAAAAILLQNNLLHQIETNPVGNFIIPLWVLIAYVIILFWQPKEKKIEQDKQANKGKPSKK